MDLNLTGKNVLITGGSKGIGKEIARQFVNEGANVAIVGRTYETLVETQKELGEIKIYQADVTNREKRTDLMNEYLKNHQSIDVLINNAGGSNGQTALETELDLFYEAFEYNYFSAVHLSQLASKEMVKQKSGSIVNITSIFGRESGGLVTYNNAKAALISFTKALGDELISQGVNVNSVAPGSVYHEGGVWARRTKENPEAIEQFVQADIPAGRFGTPEEIAQTVVFLASEKASWISGTCINVDGGQSKSNI